MSQMRWSEAPIPDGNDGINNNNNNGTPTTPQIKNHSVTHHRGYLYCFGGYDGRRNHQTLLIYSLRDQCWMTPSAGVVVNNSNQHFTVRGNPPPGRNGHTATLACSSRRSRQQRRQQRNNNNNINVDDVMNNNDDNQEANQRPSDAEVVVDQALAELAQNIDAMDAALENNNSNNNDPVMINIDSSSAAPLNANENENSQSGDNVNPMDADDNNNNNNDNEQQQQQQMEEDNDEEDDDEDAQIVIIGGWLGSGPLAANDMWVLDISGGLDRLRWFQPPILGTPPGPCNMHSADFIPLQNEVYVFRGGNGREYLNDLNALDVETYTWRTVETHGTPPQQRANHSSALLDDTHNGGKSELFIFGGWNGSERLNDIHILDTETSTWSTPRVLGVKPHPRAGMTLTALRGRLYLFGGSGTSSKCFDDLQVLDRKEMAWLDVITDDGDDTQHRQQQKQQLTFGNTASYNFDNNNSSWEMLNSSRGEGSGTERATSSSSWEVLGGQDGMLSGNGGGGGYDENGIKFADWRQYSGVAGGQPVCNSANPNDEDMIPSVHVDGKPPGRRAGHTSTAVGRHIYVFGGSCGTDYLNDFFALDTDPPPMMKVTEPPSPQLYASRLRHFYNDEEFSDVTFLVEGRKVFGHKLVLSTVSDCFRAMFMTGFRESGSAKTEIEIPNCTYNSFVKMMEYIYTGRAPHNIDVFSSSGSGMDMAISLLELADQFFLYNLKQIIEGVLQPAVNGETYVFLRQVAQKTNANQLESYCRYFERNMNELRAE